MSIFEHGYGYAPIELVTEDFFEPQTNCAIESFTERGKADYNSIVAPLVGCDIGTLDSASIRKLHEWRDSEEIHTILLKNSGFNSVMHYICSMDSDQSVQLLKLFLRISVMYVACCDFTSLMFMKNNADYTAFEIAFSLRNDLILSTLLVWIRDCGVEYMRSLTQNGYLRLLSDYKASLLRNVNDRGTVLHFAIERKCTHDELSSILSSSSIQSIINVADQNGFTPLDRMVSLISELHYTDTENPEYVEYVNMISTLKSKGAVCMNTANITYLREVLLLTNEHKCAVFNLAFNAGVDIVNATAYRDAIDSLPTHVEHSEQQSMNHVTHDGSLDYAIGTPITIPSQVHLLPITCDTLNKLQIHAQESVIPENDRYRPLSGNLVGNNISFEELHKMRYGIVENF